MEEREKYKAVFNDQYQEYKDLHRDISVTLSKFRELDAMMERLPREANSTEVRCIPASQVIINHLLYTDINYHSGFHSGSAQDSKTFKEVSTEKECK